MGTVFNIQRYCSNDGPGIRTTVFLKGCPLNCIWCHNPESKSALPQIMYNASKCLGCGACVQACEKDCHSISEGMHSFDRRMCIGCGKCAALCPGALDCAGKSMTAAEVLDIVERDRPFYGENGGMTISGGEPFFQFPFLMELLEEAGRRHIGVCLETCGQTSAEQFKATLPYVDRYLYDCKETDPELHKRWTGVGNQRILENLALLNEHGARIVLRCPIIPGCNDREDHFRAIGTLTKMYPSILQVDVEPYHPLGASKSANLGVDYILKDVEFPSAAQAELWIGEIRENATCPVGRA